MKIRYVVEFPIVVSPEVIEQHGPLIENIEHWVRSVLVEDLEGVQSLDEGEFLIKSATIED